MLILILSIVSLIIADFIPLLGLILGIVTLIIGIRNKKYGIKYASIVIVISAFAIFCSVLGIIIELGFNNVNNYINNVWSNN